MTSKEPYTGAVCPVENDPQSRITLGHGGGGRLTRDLIETRIRPLLGNPFLNQEHDGAVLPNPGAPIAFTTDSYVVTPLFFPGGDIGTLAVYGTVNDLCMSGAIPKFLSLSLILQEGLEISTFESIMQSIKLSAKLANVQIVTGDTKVIEGQGDEAGMFITTSGIGITVFDPPPSPFRIAEGDLLVLNGDIGRHGTCILALRDGMEFETEIRSDCAPLTDQVQALYQSKYRINCMRDLTRGGLSAAVVELARSGGWDIELYEPEIPVLAAVQSACDLFGLDPLAVANEGRFIAFVDARDGERVSQVLAEQAPGAVRTIGRVIGPDKGGQVRLRNAYGGERILDLYSGEQLPRIC
ncbi:hydrogenase expression/formation protein HypE [candidate division KSB1 bacterium]|nr:hydrogenase expression/formation protein HypE [candidate division KSB1 bacterium]